MWNIWKFALDERLVFDRKRIIEKWCSYRGATSHGDSSNMAIRNYYLCLSGVAATRRGSSSWWSWGSCRAITLYAGTRGGSGVMSCPVGSLREPPDGLFFSVIILNLRFGGV